MTIYDEARLQARWHADSGHGAVDLILMAIAAGEAAEKRTTKAEDDLSRCACQLEETEAELNETQDLYERTEGRQKALQEAAGALCAAAAEAFVVRDGAGMASLPIWVARVRALIPGALAAVVASKEMP